jgi:hypothetical protein
MVVDSESLLVLVQRSKLSQEREVFLRILGCQLSFSAEAYLLRVLSHHEDKLEVVHPKRYVVELVDVRQEDDVLDGIFYNLGVIRYDSQLVVFEQEAKTHFAAGATGQDRTRSLPAACRRV